MEAGVMIPNRAGRAAETLALPVQVPAGRFRRSVGPSDPFAP